MTTIRMATIPSQPVNNSITQKQIAEHLGLSWSVVTRALKDHPAVALATRERVQEAARQMGYSSHNNYQARALVARRYGNRVATGMISVLMPAGAGDTMHATPFFASLLEGITGGAMENGLDVSFFVLRPKPDGHDGLPRMIGDGAVDGVISIQGLPQGMTARLNEIGLPVVNVMSRQEESHSIGIANREGVCLAVRHLIELGHERIGYIGFSLDGDYYPNPEADSERLVGYRQALEVGRERLAGYQEALEEAGLPFHEQRVEATLLHPLMEDGIAATARLFERAPDCSAVFCHNDLVAMGAIHWLEEQGRRVPDDVSVIGFDDVSLQYGFRPALSSIFFDRAAMGRRAVEILCAANRQNEAHLSGYEAMPVSVAERASTRAVADAASEWHGSTLVAGGRGVTPRIKAAKNSSSDQRVAV